MGIKCGDKTVLIKLMIYDDIVITVTLLITTKMMIKIVIIMIMIKSHNGAYW